MKSQSMLVASFMSIVLIVMLLFILFIYILPGTLTSRETSYVSIDVYRLIDSRGNWTARELVEAIISRYNPDYVNVSINVYNVLDHNKLVYSDHLIYRLYNVSINELFIHRYIYTRLYRNGYYVEYIVEVGFK